MLAAMDIAPVDDLADIEPVLEQMGERADAEPDAAPLAAVAAVVDLGPDAAPIKVLDQSAHRAKLEIALEDQPNGRGLLRRNHQLLVDAAIAQRDRSANPDALAL